MAVLVGTPKPKNILKGGDGINAFINQACDYLFIRLIPFPVEKVSDGFISSSTVGEVIFGIFFAIFKQEKIRID